MMSACLLCSNTFQGFALTDEASDKRAARDFIQGLVVSLGNGEGLRSFQESVQPLPRRGICVVERCALFVESACRGCRETDCQRCAIAAELRAAEDRINAERDAEIADLPIEDVDISAILDRIATNLCVEHVAFRPVLVSEWYNRQSFLNVPVIR